jgi:hypothetical protein
MKILRRSQDGGPTWTSSLNRCPGDTDPSGGTWQVFAEVLRGGSSRQSPRTAVSGCRNPGPLTGSFVSNINLERQLIFEGIIPYYATWDPGLPNNARLVSIEYPQSTLFQQYPYRLALWTGTGSPEGGLTWDQCGTPEASVILAEGQTTTDADLVRLYRTSTPTPPISIWACIGFTDQSPPNPLDLVPIRVNFVRE